MVLKRLSTSNLWWEWPCRKTVHASHYMLGGLPERSSRLYWWLGGNNSIICRAVHHFPRPHYSSSKVIMKEYFTKPYFKDPLVYWTVAWWTAGIIWLLGQLSLINIISVVCVNSFVTVTPGRLRLRSDLKHNVRTNECEKCGTKNERFDSFCFTCGSKL